jgi:DNA repair exonuclease SbcCD nuclease subunit
VRCERPDPGEFSLLKLLHTADWQIGKLYGQFEPDEAALLAQARFSVVEKLARLAADSNLDAVLVAGDVFDAQGVADKTILRLFNAMAAFKGPWVLIPGNHDAALTESVWSRAQRLKAVPGNVHVCLRPEPLVLASLQLVLLPAPLRQRHTYVDLTEWFSAAKLPDVMSDSVFRIGVAHGSVQGILAEGIDSSNPIAAGRAEQAGLDYLALGDWHGTRQIDARTWYSGTPETDRFKANDSGQALLVELAEPGALPVVITISTTQYRWQSEAMVLQVPSDVDQAVQRLAEFGAADVVQISFSGQTDLAGHQRLQDAVDQARGRARSLLVDFSALKLDPTPQDVAALMADGYLGDVVAELQAAQNSPMGQSSDTELAKDALVLLAGILQKQLPVKNQSAEQSKSHAGSHVGGRV